MAQLSCQCLCKSETHVPCLTMAFRASWPMLNMAKGIPSNSSPPDVLGRSPRAGTRGMRRLQPSSQQSIVYSVDIPPRDLSMPPALHQEPAPGEVPGPSKGNERDPSLTDDNKRRRQEAGLNVLFSIASLLTLERAEEATAYLPVVSWPESPPRSNPSPSSGIEAPGERAHEPTWRRLRTWMRTDHMVRNALYLILNSGLQAGLGFAFWIITARLFTPAEVGRASSLISATTVISYLGLLGLNSTFVRYLPTALNPERLITAGLLLVAACGATISLIYVALMPVLAPRLAFVEHQPELVIGFVILTAASAANLLTDSVFISARRAGLCTLTDAAIGGTTKVISVILLAGTGAYGIYSSSASGFATAALASLVLMATALHYRPSLRKSFQTLKPILGFSTASYIGNFLNMLPTLVVPLIVLDRLGSAAAAYYFVAFQVATLLYSTAHAVGQSSLAEGSQATVDWRHTLRRSRRVLTLLCAPLCLLLVTAAHWIMLAFGAKYSQYGTPSLVVLAVAAGPIAANNWLMTRLSLARHLRAIVLSNVIYALAICSLAWLLAPYGLTALTGAWPAGCLIASAVAAGARHRPPPRHRKAIRLRRGVAPREGSPTPDW